ncbi:MAG: hypothetical protein Q8K81_04565 [Sulfuricurvum sp.]|nr:hypothetical protein [Sulfuricurvum sp.]
MTTEWINIADTAVKIGLGSVITGFFTFIGLRYSHKSQQSKYMFEHKIKLIEQISADIDEYFTALTSFTNLIAGIAKRRNIDQKDEIPLNQTQWQVIRNNDELLIASWTKRTYAIAKLRLLKANGVVTKLNQCVLLDKELRDKIVFDKIMYKYDEINDYRQKLNEAKSAVHSTLSDFYDSLLK